MTPSKTITIRPNALKLLRSQVVGVVGIMGAMAVVLVFLFGLDWLWTSGWIIIAATGTLVACFCAVLFLLAALGRMPRVEIGPDGFIACSLLGTRSRRWGDIEGDFVTIQLRWGDIEGDFVTIQLRMGKAVAYRLTETYKKAAGFKPTTLWAGYDEAIGGLYQVSIDELTELLNQHKRLAAGLS